MSLLKRYGHEAYLFLIANDVLTAPAWGREGRAVTLVWAPVLLTAGKPDHFWFFYHSTELKFQPNFSSTNTEYSALRMLLTWV